jgi:hypothetical protein
MVSLGRVIASALFHGLIQVSAVDPVDWMIAGLDRRAGALMAAQGLEVHAPPGRGPAPYLGYSACGADGGGAPILVSSPVPDPGTTSLVLVAVVPSKLPWPVTTNEPVAPRVGDLALRLRGVSRDDGPRFGPGRCGSARGQ